MDSYGYNPFSYDSQGDSSGTSNSFASSSNMHNTFGESSYIFNPFPNYSNTNDTYQYEEEITEEIEEDEDNLLDWQAVCSAAAYTLVYYYDTFVHKEPCGTSVRTGSILISEIMNGNERRCYQDFRMKKGTFLAFCRILVDRYGLVPTQGMSEYEEVGMFLMTIAHGCGNRLMQEMWNHSGETISRHFHSVLKAVCRLASDYITPASNYNTGSGYHTPQHDRYHPYFEDVIGAVDGWEGGAHDSRILTEATTQRDLNFPHPTGKKLYLVDAGYPHKRGYMAPYKGSSIRYHLADYRRGEGSERAPRNPKENFNHLHSSCRMVIERTFGVWKARFAILANMLMYKIDTQTDIVLATMTIHNYIRKSNCNDSAFRTAERENYVPGDSTSRINNSGGETKRDEGDVMWLVVCDSIAQRIHYRT